MRGYISIVPKPRAVIDQIRTKIPTDIRTGLKGTPVETLYRGKVAQRVRAMAISTEEAVIPTEVGTITLNVSPYSGLLSHNEYPGYEPGLVERLGQVIDKESVVYDIGAGYGYNCNVALAAGALPSNLHLFEASPFRFPFLVENSPNCSINEAYVSNTDSNNSLEIDTYLFEKETPDIVTMDIEGGELECINGMTELLSGRDVELLIEMHPEKLGEAGHKRTIENIHSFDYRVDVRDHRDAASSWQFIGESHEIPFTSGTYLLRAVPSEQT